MKMSYLEVLALLDADTLTDMIYDDKDKGRPSRTLNQMVYDFAESKNITIEEDKK